MAHPDRKFPGLRPAPKTIGLLLLAAAALLLLQKCEERTDAPQDVRETEPNRNVSPTLPRQQTPSGATTAESVQERLVRILARVRQTGGGKDGQDTEARRRMLENTAQYLIDLPPREAAAAILQQLASGADAATGLPFEPDEEGMKGWSTWRVYLLDMLGMVDPKQAAEYARASVFTRYESPDEWAIAMRSVLASAPEPAQPQAKAELSSLLERMLAQEEWRASPTGGMFEAMDFIAQTPDASLHIGQLQKWAAESGYGIVDTALQLAAERATARQPARMITALASDANLLSSTSAQRVLRASVMARANLREAVQAEAVRAYLVRLPGESEETAAFFSLFPNHRFSVAPGLAATPVLPTAGEMRAADEAALAKMAVWQSDPALAVHADSLQKLEGKLRRLVAP